MSKAPGATTWSIGDRHLAVVQPPDIVRLTIVGDVSAPDVQGTFDALHDAAAVLTNPFFAVVDVSRMGALTPEGRKEAARTYNLPRCVMVVVGATRVHRTVFQLVIKAYQLLSKDPDPIQTLFMGSEAEALRWIEERRRVD